MDAWIAPPRHFSSASPFSGEGIKGGNDVHGAGYEPGPRGTAPGSAQRDRHRKTPLDEPGSLMTIILGRNVVECYFGAQRDFLEGGQAVHLDFPDDIAARATLICCARIEV